MWANDNRLQFYETSRVDGFLSSFRFFFLASVRRFVGFYVRSLPFRVNVKSFSYLHSLRFDGDYTHVFAYDGTRRRTPTLGYLFVRSFGFRCVFLPGLAARAVAVMITFFFTC